MDDSPLIRLAPLQISDLPDHSSFHALEPTETPRPDLKSFLLAFLDDGNRFVDNKNFNANFKHHSHKQAPPSYSGSAVLTHDVQSSTLDKINWANTGIPGYSRLKPRDLPNEHWFARRSYHANVSSKEDPSSASWDEFVFGLRDDHSKHECDFTPTLYDAYHVLDWNEEISKNASEWGMSDRATGDSTRPSYTNIALAVYEMCHALPWPLGPRCFAVLVATASTSADRFIAVTVPVDLSNFPGAFYSTGRNRKEGDSSQKRKEVIVGVYNAVESVERHKPGEQGNASDKERIQWVMATASDAKGNLPMTVQKTSMPSQVPKDITYFLKWVRTVD